MRFQVQSRPKLERVQFSLSLFTKRNARNQHHHHHQMEVADIAIAPLKEFVRDSARLVKKCTKPDRREFTLIASKTAFGASSRSSSSSSSSSSYHHRSLFLCVLSPHVSRFFGGNQIHIYISRRCLAGLTKKRSLSTSLKTRQVLSCLGSSGSS